jgi:hypothetical protein
VTSFDGNGPSPRRRLSAAHPSVPSSKRSSSTSQKENPSWGYGKLEGELGKHGYDIGRPIIRAVLKRKHVPPAPERSKQGSTWRTFLAHYQDQIVACDFFTVETVWLKTLYVLCFIELGSHRVHLVGCTTNPTSA